MKLKVLPEDFVVEELSDFPITNKGDYNVYKLEKRYWNTLDALEYLARKNNLNFSAISYGGKKDRYATTSQFLTVFQNKLDLQTGYENLKLTFLGTAKEPFKPNHIKSNRFQIVIRDLSQSDIDDIQKNFSNLKKSGFPNYFGEQRFGSFDERCGFFAEKFLKAQYNGAVKAALCSIFPQDKGSDKERKELFFQHWGDFDFCLKHAKTRLEKSIFTVLINHPKKFLDAIHSLPTTDVSMYFAAYQSYLWNKMLDKILSQRIKDSLYMIRIKNWRLTSFKLLKSDDQLYLKALKIPTHGLNPYFCNDDVEVIYDETLKEEGLHQGRFNFRHYRKVIIKSFQRDVIVFPENSFISKPERDEIYNGKLKIKLSFELPRGSFATTLIKHLINQE